MSPKKILNALTVSSEDLIQPNPLKKKISSILTERQCLRSWPGRCLQATRQQEMVLRQLVSNIQVPEIHEPVLPWTLSLGLQWEDTESSYCFIPKH